MSLLSFQAVSCLLTSNTARLQQLEDVCERGEKKKLIENTLEDKMLK